MNLKLFRDPEGTLFLYDEKSPGKTLIQVNDSENLYKDIIPGEQISVKLVKSKSTLDISSYEFSKKNLRNYLSGNSDNKLKLFVEKLIYWSDKLLC